MSSYLSRSLFKRGAGTAPLAAAVAPGSASDALVTAVAVAPVLDGPRPDDSAAEGPTGAPVAPESGVTPAVIEAAGTPAVDGT